MFVRQDMFKSIHFGALTEYDLLILEKIKKNV